MNKLETFIRKNSLGAWFATTDVPLYGDYQLKISTRKSLGDLLTTATVHKTSNGLERHLLHQDYYQLILRSTTRVTKNAVDAQHMKILGSLPVFIAEATAHQQKLNKGT